MDAEGRQFTYDAENKQVQAENSNNSVLGTYFFDGDGKRVKKVVPNGETTVFVYDASNRLIGEYSTEVQPSQDAKTQYLTADHLNTPRINTNAVGTVMSRSDYMPYGEEITSGRSSGQGYVVDDVRQGFTGYERDAETGLDFAQARYFASDHGRFSTPDPLQSSAETTGPQTWNRYAYALNNPVLYADPDGMDVELMDDKARRNVLLTLPANLRKEVEAQIDKNGVLKQGVLDNIKSKDQNFLALKELVNHKNLTEVMTGTQVLGANFYERTAKENKEKDIKEYMASNGVSRAAAEKFYKSINQKWNYSNLHGYTLTPSESPSGNLRIIVTDQTGEAAKVSELEAVKTTGHELYGHGLLFSQGKTYEHGPGKVPDSVFKRIEQRTAVNYRSTEQKKNAPKNLRPKK